MDPIANLKEQRTLAREIIDASDDALGGPDPEHVERLAELVLALIEWRESGGFDPHVQVRRPIGEQRAPLPDRLNHLAQEFAGKAWEHPDSPHASYLRDHAYSLSEFAQQVEEEYVRTAGGEEEGVPTTAQGVALARFLRSRLKLPGASATVSRGAFGLPTGYVHVVCDDGYEGGIAPDGSTST